jgi:hypothetical protein
LPYDTDCDSAWNLRILHDRLRDSDVHDRDLLPVVTRWKIYEEER